VTYAGPIVTESLVATGLVVTAVRSCHVRSRLPVVDPPIIYLHSAAGDATEAVGTVHPSLRAKIAAAVGHDRAVYAITTGGFPFGQAPAIELVETLCDWLDLRGHDTSQGIGLMGVSMGSTGVLRYAAAQDGATRPTLFGVTFLNVHDLTTPYETNSVGNRDIIGAACGVTYPEPLPDGCCPTTLVDELVAQGAPLLLTCGADDQYGTGLADFGAAIGATVLRPAGVGHVDGAVSGVPTATVRAFIESHLEG
jgi:pimeloyl-ACP methyl ester carboxylesterase